LKKLIGLGSFICVTVLIYQHFFCGLVARVKAAGGKNGGPGDVDVILGNFKKSVLVEPAKPLETPPIIGSFATGC
jgi:hypothetical protein